MQFGADIAESILDSNLFGGGGSSIQSIQSGTAILTAQTLDVAITAVDLTKSVLIMSIKTTTAGNTRESSLLIRGKLTSATNINFAMDAAFVEQITVKWQVVTFNNVKSLQRGDLALSLTNQNVTISAVDPLKTLLFFNYNSTTATSFVSGNLVAGSIANATTLNFLQSGSTKNLHWQVIEFN